MKTTPAAGPDLGPIKAYVGELTRQEEQQRQHAAELGRSDVYALLRGEGFELSGATLSKEAGARFVALRDQISQDYTRTMAELQRTRTILAPLQGLLRGIEQSLTPMADLPAGVGPAKNALIQRQYLTQSIEAVKRMVLAAGAELANKFPTAQLELIDKSLKQEIAELNGVIAKGTPVQATAPRAFVAPVPKSTVLTLADVPTGHDAAAAIARLLGDAQLEATLKEAIGLLAVKGPERARFEQALQGMAMVADFASGTLDYARTGGPMFTLPDNRQDHRDRNFLPDMMGASAGRQRQAKLDLAAAVKAALGNKDLVGAMEQTLVSSFLQQISVPAPISAGWKPDPKAVLTALSDELFAPLRALHEMIPGPYTGRYDGATIKDMQAIVNGMTQAVVEGRYEEWRTALPGNQAQLDVLPKDKQAAWLEGGRHESKTANGAVSSHEAEGHERFWATKVGGPSHAFDVMAQCILSILGNVRTKAIVVNHEAFKGGPGARAYLRLLGGADGKPVVYLEGLQVDFKLNRSHYPLKGDLIQQAALHALAKAKELGARLVVRSEYVNALRQQGLQVQGFGGAVVLMPSAVVNESSDTLMFHDERQTDRRITQIYGGPYEVTY